MRRRSSSRAHVSAEPQRCSHLVEALVAPQRLPLGALLPNVSETRRWCAGNHATESTASSWADSGGTSERCAQKDDDEGADAAGSDGSGGDASAMGESGCMSGKVR